MGWFHKSLENMEKMLKAGDYKGSKEIFLKHVKGEEKFHRDLDALEQYTKYYKETLKRMEEKCFQNDNEPMWEKIKYMDIELKNLKANLSSIKLHTKHLTADMPEIE